MLCRYWPQKANPVPQFVIPMVYVPVILKLVHSVGVAGHPGKERTLNAARAKYYWPRMKLDIPYFLGVKTRFFP